MVIRRRWRDAPSWQGERQIEAYHTGKLILCRSLAAIEQRSRALMEKGKCASFLDKAQDTQEVANLVEQLRQAILIYQVGTEAYQDEDS
jgi:hypothetical protein